MTARRITIGMKPGAQAIEAPESVHVEEQNGATPSFHQQSAATIEEFVNGVHEAKPGHPTAEAWVKRGGETAKGAATASFGGMSPILMAGAGAGIGALVAAIAVVMLLPRLTPSVDVRLAPVADRVAAIETRQQQTEVGLGRLNNEVAQAIEADGVVTAKLEEQATALAEFEKMIASQPVTGAVAGDAGNLTVFAVAVGQLRAAFYDGRPFEAELVNVYALAGDDESLRQSLNELSAPARAGVGNPALLRQQFAASAAAAGLALGEPQGYYDYGMSMVNQYIGYSGEPYSVELANITVNDADRKLAAGDVAGAVGLVKGIDRTIVAAFQPWLESAGGYVRAEAAIAALTETVVERLRQRMGADDAG
jgi:hypothetical protein